MDNKMKTVLLVICTFVATTIMAQAPQAHKKWELSGFNNPESIVKDGLNNVLYVSNVNGVPTDKDSNGFISKVSVDGKMITQKWVEGLNAPKGMVIYKKKLYVADINEIVEIDIVSSKIIKRYQAEGATFLNDLTCDKDGNIYASNTFGGSAIYKLDTSKKVEIFLKDEKLQLPNGLFQKGKSLFVVSWGIDFDPNTWKTKIPGSLLKVDLLTKSIEAVSKPIGNLDGLEEISNGYLITDWLSGKLIYYSNDIATDLIDLPQGSADIGFDKKSNTVFIPQMNDNKIVAYQLK